MKKILALFAVTFCLFSQLAQAKDTAVLLPIGGTLTATEKSSLTQEIVTNLAPQFELTYGDEVDQFVKKAFQEESKKKDCDETNCYRRIAAKFHAEKIVALRLTQIGKARQLMVLHIYDVQTGEVTASEKGECTDCSLEKLKTLSKKLISATLKSSPK
ncbi:MAG: hypothetical protein WCI39_13155 [Gallionellaceae bacterium]